MKKKCLVTGSTAVLGSAFKDLLRTSNNSDYIDDLDYVFIGSKDCDLVNKGEVYNFFEENKFTYVIHLAAISGGLGLSGKKFQSTLFYKNVSMMLNILEASKDFKIEKLLLTLSTGMYSPDLDMPYKKKTYIQDPRTMVYMDITMQRE